MIVEASNKKIKNWVCECGYMQKKPIFFKKREYLSCKNCNLKADTFSILGRETGSVDYLKRLLTGLEYLPWIKSEPRNKDGSVIKINAIKLPNPAEDALIEELIFKIISSDQIIRQKLKNSDEISNINKDVDSFKTINNRSLKEFEDDFKKEKQELVIKEKEDGFWNDGLKITCFITTAFNLYGVLTSYSDVKLIVGIIASFIFGPILGIIVYFLGQLLWIVLSGVFSETSEYAEKKGVPKPFAIVFGLICVCLMAIGMEGF